jgi:hypothetical protein
MSVGRLRQALNAAEAHQRGTSVLRGSWKQPDEVRWNQATGIRRDVGDSAPANGRLLTSTFTSNALRHLSPNAHMTTNSAQARLDNIQQSLNPPMSQPINNEIKGRLALVTGASGG